METRCLYWDEKTFRDEDRLRGGEWTDAPFENEPCGECLRCEREPEPGPTPAELVAAVKKHALANYDADGWDFVVECWSDAEIAEKVSGCRSAERAIAVMGESVRLHDEQRSEVESTRW